MLSLYIAGNALIVAAYVVLAILFGSWRALSKTVVVPAFAFFILCGITHFDLMSHAISKVPITTADQSSPYHVILHLTQGVSALIAAVGLFSARIRIAALLEELGK